MLFCFFWEGEKKIAGSNFSGSRHFEYFPKPVFFLVRIHEIGKN